jgi:hypothetical protein
MSTEGAICDRPPAGQNQCFLPEVAAAVCGVSRQAASPAGKLCAIGNGNARCYGQDGEFGRYIEALYEDRAQNLWVAAASVLAVRIA